MSHIFLCGIKHSGKTTIGRLLAQKLNRRWYDLDHEIEKRIDQPIRTFYREAGVTAFQTLEVEVLSNLVKEKEIVISLGGGASDNEELMALVKKAGTLVYLWVEEKELLKRILLGGVPPFLDEADPEGSFSQLYQRRNRRYSKDCNHLIQLPFDQDSETNAELVWSSLGLKE